MSLLLSCVLCCSEDDASKGDWWMVKRPPGVACTPALPDGMDPTAGVSFDTSLALCVQIEMAPEDHASLSTDTRFGPGLGSEGALAAFATIAGQCGEPWPDAYAWYEADVTVDGVLLKKVGARRKGFIGSLFVSVPSFKIKTDKYVDGQFLGDTERLTLNSSGGAAQMATCLAFELFESAGYPAPRCNIANVMVNGEPLGSYVHVESIKKRFLKRVFGDAEGSLYEGTQTDFVEPWLTRFEVKTDDTDAQFEPLLQVARALEKPDDELVAALEPLVNLDRFITFWALEVVVRQADGYGGDRNNYYVYFDPSDNQRAVLIPWGVDKAMSGDKGGDVPLESYLKGELARRLSRIPAMAAKMEDELQRLVTEAWDEPALLASIERFGAQVSAAQDSDTYDQEVQAVADWVKQRPDSILELLADGLPAGAPDQGTCMNDKADSGDKK